MRTKSNFDPAPCNFLPLASSNRVNFRGFGRFSAKNRGVSETSKRGILASKLLVASVVAFLQFHFCQHRYLFSFVRLFVSTDVDRFAREQHRRGFDEIDTVAGKVAHKRRELELSTLKMILVKYPFSSVYSSFPFSVGIISIGDAYLSECLFSVQPLDVEIKGPAREIKP